jgi:hypothetical protein
MRNNARAAERIVFLHFPSMRGIANEDEGLGGANAEHP